MKNKFIKVTSALLSLILMVVILVNPVYAQPNININSANSVVVNNNITISISNPNTNQSFNGTLSVSGPATASLAVGLGPSETQSITVKPTSTGTLSVRFNGVYSPADPSDPNFGKDVPISRSKTISVVAATPAPTPTPTPTPTPPPADTRDSNSRLSLLNVSEGTLSPAFNANTMEYRVELEHDVKSVTIDATPAISSGRVLSGQGEHSVALGENKIDIRVMAENETTTTYTVVFVVKEEPLTKVMVGDTEMSIVRDLEDVTITGFKQEKITIDEKEYTVFTQGKFKLIYLVNEANDEKAFYQVNEDNEIVELWNPLIFNEKFYLVVEIEETLQTREGTTFEMMTIQDQEVGSWLFEEEQLAHLKLVYLMDTQGELNYYLYDESEEQLVRFMDAQIVSGQEVVEESGFLNNLSQTELLIILGGAVAILGVLTTIIVVRKRRN